MTLCERDRGPVIVFGTANPGLGSTTVPDPADGNDIESQLDELVRQMRSSAPDESHREPESHDESPVPPSAAKAKTGKPKSQGKSKAQMDPEPEPERSITELTPAELTNKIQMMIEGGFGLGSWGYQSQ